MKQVIVLACTLLLAACAGLKAPPAPQDGFSASGRVSVRSGEDAHYANFAWLAEARHDRLSLGNPLGQILAELEISHRDGEPGQAVLRDAEGGVRTGEAQTVLLEATGMRLPVAGMRWWLQGLPAPGEASLSDDGQTRVIEQDGWIVQAGDFGQQNPLRGPRRIVLTRGDMVVRIVISEWQWQNSPRP